MCCGLWLTKTDEAAGGSRKIVDKGMQIRAGMEYVEEDIAQEGNANKGKVLRWCLRNHEARIYIYIYIIYVCVCVCVCMKDRGKRRTEIERERGYRDTKRR